MGVVNKPYTFQNLTKADAPQVNADLDTLYNEFNGNISQANMKPAGITTLAMFATALVYGVTDWNGIVSRYSNNTPKISTTVGEVLYTTSFVKNPGTIRLRVRVYSASLDGSNNPVTGNNAYATLYVNGSLVTSFTNPGTGTDFDYTYNLERPTDPAYADGATITVQLKTAKATAPYKLEAQNFEVETNQVISVKLA